LFQIQGDVFRPKGRRQERRRGTARQLALGDELEDILLVVMPAAVGVGFLVVRICLNEWLPNVNGGLIDFRKRCGQ
jgi:hypothetical protein